ncbi:putative ATP-dependent RNA helicase DHR1 [Batrachochytrium dendrobatidis]
MGRQGARYNAKARAASHLTTSAKPHSKPRDGGIKASIQKINPTVIEAARKTLHASKPKSVLSTNETTIQKEDLSNQNEYTSSTTTIPYILPPKETRVASTANEVANRLALLTEAQTVKISGKKRKRMEKFIEREMKKEERVYLYEKLGKQEFSSELFKSSKKLSSGKLTARERLRQALLEERSGIPQSDPSVQLLKPVIRPTEIPDNTMQVDFDESESSDNCLNVESTPIESMGIVSRSFGMAAQSAPIIVTSSEHGTTSVELVPSNTSVSSIIHNRPVLGSSLRENTATTPGGKPAEPSKRVLKKRQRREIRQQMAKLANSNSENSDSDSDGSMLEDTDDNKESISTACQKALWSSNVVSGESFNQTLSTNTVKSIDEKPSHSVSTLKKTLSIPGPKAIFVPVDRSEEIQLARLSLPVTGEEQLIMETILANDITILCGETGSGKTTQVPQFLYEAGFGDKSHPLYPGMIGITQPRRVAAVSMANRVAFEMNLHKGEVAYQIRYDRGLTGKNTRIKFMTDGVLLRELSGDITPLSTSITSASTKKGSDILLSDYSCIVIDEAHERTVGTDVLIGWLTRVVRLRNSGKIQNIKPLRVVIMSATLRVQDFTDNKALFPDGNPPPVIKVEGRQHKVVVHYNKITPEIDYVSEAFKKVSKIHKKLPPGAILVFVTGQQEVQVLVKKLRATFSKTISKDSIAQTTDDIEMDDDNSIKGVFGESEAVAEAYEENLNAQKRQKSSQLGGEERDDFDEMEQLEADEDEDNEEEEVHILGGISDDEDENEADKAFVPSVDLAPVHVLPLYSMLPTKAQLQIFDPPPEGARLIVVATNVAETSITIPGVKYVVDCGKVKERQYDAYTGVQTFQVSWTSKASADQRAGRAGRMGAGHCYRLFSSAVYNNYFEKFATPEIMRVPIEDVVMQMKAMGINQISNFPFPSPPNCDNLNSAERLLKYLGALDLSAAVSSSQTGVSSQFLEITSIGRLMSKFPVSPRFAKMLVVAAKQSQPVLPYIVAVISGLSVGDPIVRDVDLIKNTNQSEQDEEDADDHDGKEERRKKRTRFFQIMQAFSGSSSSDVLCMLNAIGAYAAERSRSAKSLENFCESHFLRPKAMEEIHKLRIQITNILKSVLAHDTSDIIQKNVSSLSSNLSMSPPNTKTQTLIRQILLTGFPDKIARLNENAVSGYGKHAVPVYQTLWADNLKETHLVHASSCLYSQRPAPKWIIYSEVVGHEERFAADNSHVMQMRGSNITIMDDANPAEPVRRWLKQCTVVNESWLSTMCPPSLVRTGRLLTQPEPHYVAAKDHVVGYVVPVFGPCLWELGLTETNKNLDEMTRIMWFAKALLEGTVVGSMNLEKKRTATKDVFGLMRKFMSTKPSVVTKSWARSQNKVSLLLDTLARSHVTTRSDLAKMWHNDKTFLLDATLAWVPVEFHPILCKYWPPITGGSVKNESLYSALSSFISATNGDQVESFKPSTVRNADSQGKGYDK